MEEPKENKQMYPTHDEPWKPKAKTVMIKISPNRKIAGVGKAGDVVEVSELVAKNFVSQGLATYVKEK